MRFAKYHGIGNDFVMLADPDEALSLTPSIVRALSDRRFGIGADGVIRVAERLAYGPSTGAIVSEAQRRNIPVLRLDPRRSLVQLG
ncbi:MAG: hypothetical protein ACLGHL_06270, partial [Actinomycetota bacterium]